MKNKELLIKQTIDSLKKLPESSVQEVSHFAEYLLSKVDDSILTENIMQLASESKSYSFLEDEEELYSVNDLKEKYK